MKLTLPVRSCWLQLTVYIVGFTGLLSVLANHLLGFDVERQLFMLPVAGWWLMLAALLLHVALHDQPRLLPGLAVALAVACLLILLTVEEGSERHRTLALPVLLSAMAYALGRRPSRLARTGALLLGVAVMLLAVLSQLSYWVPALLPLQLPQKLPAATLANGMVLLLGLAAVLLASASDQRRLLPNRIVAIAGLMGALATSMAWVLMSWQGSEAYRSQSSLLLPRMEVAIQRSMESRLALLGRMALRWEVMGRLPDESFWRFDSESYLRDVGDLSALVVLDERLRPVRQASRGAADARRFAGDLQNPIMLDRLAQARSLRVPQVISARLGMEGSADHVLLSIPLNIKGRGPGQLVAGVDLRLLFAQVSRDLGGMDVRILESGALVYESDLRAADPRTVLLDSRQIALVSPHFDFRWDIQVLQALDVADINAPALIPLWVLLIGLAGTLFLMLHQGQSIAYAEKTGTLESTLQKQLMQQAYRQRIIDHSADMLCTFDVQGRFLQVNPACERMLGYKSEELLGRQFITLVVPEDVEQTRQEVAAIMGGRAIESFRNRYLHRDGHIVHLRWSAEWAPEDQTLYAIAHDITHVILRERYAEGQRHVLAQISKGAALPHTLELICLMLEEQILGSRCSVMLADAAKKTLSVGAAPHLPTEYLAQISALEIAPDSGSCGAAAYHREPVVIRDIRSHPNWERLWDMTAHFGLVSCWSVPVMADDGEVLGTLALYHDEEHEPEKGQMEMVSTAAELAGVAIKRTRDLRQIQESEQRFRSLFQYNPDPVYSFDMEGCFQSMNEAGQALLGYTAEQIVGQPWGRSVTDESRPEVERRLMAALKGEPQRYTLQLRNRAGRLLTLDVSYLPIFVDGKLQGIFGLAKDITERQRVAQELKEALGEANRRAEQLRVMGRAAVTATGYTDQQSLLNYLVEQVRLAIGAHQSVISLTVDENWSQAINGVSLSEKYAKWADYAGMPDGSGIYALVCKNKQPMLLTQQELETHPAFKGFGRHADQHPPMRGWLAVPLIDREGENLGLLQLSDKFDGEFDAADLAIAQQFAQMTVTLLETNRLFAELVQAQDILRDQLTLNRLITHTLGEGLIALDAAGRPTFFNPAARRLLPALPGAEENLCIDQRLPLPPFANWPLMAASQDEFQGDFSLPKDGVHEYAYVARRMQDGWLLSLRDVTLERKVQQALQERDHFFNLSLEMFCLLDLEGHFVQVNPAFARTLEAPVEELVGTPYLRFVDQEDWPRVGQSIRELQEGGTVRELALQIKNARGRPLHLQVSAALGDDNIIYCVAHDVTESSAAQEALRSMNMLMGIAGESARLGGWAVTVEGQVTWSPELGVILEYPPGQIPPLSESLGLYHEDDRPAIVAALEGILHEGRHADFSSVRIRTAKGRWLDVRVTGRPVFDEQGFVVKAIGSLQDITDWKLAQQEAVRLSNRLYKTLESVTDCFFMVDRSWRFSYMNQEAGRVLMISRDDLIGEAIWDAFPGSYESEIGQRYRTAVQTGETQHFESYYPPMERWFEVHAYPSDEGIAVYFRDITAKKAAEQELSDTMRELERSNRELQEFAFVASHDLQEPLRKIQTFSERISSRSVQLDDEGRDYLKRMNSAASRMQALIIDLLNYSRVGTRGKDFGPVDLNQILAEVLVDMEAAIEESQAQIRVEPLPPVRGDATQLRQVIQNLLSNALKFRAPDRRPELRVAVEAQDESGWTLAISDNGIGFDEKYLEKIFAPFQRLHAREAYPGTGIGLAIVKKIVERHGGAITASSAPGQGATFRITFTSVTSSESKS